MTNKKERIIKGIAIGISIALIIFLIIFNIVKHNESKDELEENETEPITYEKHISYDGLFSIEAVKNYVEVEKYSLNEKGIIELNDESKNAYILVVMTGKDSYNGDFASYKKAAFEQKEKLYETEINSTIKVSIDNHDAEYGEIYYTTPTEVKVYMRAYAIETDNYFGQIVMWTTANNKDKIKEEFDKSAASFQEIKKLEQENDV